MSQPFSILFMSSAVIKGIIHSTTTSAAINTGARILGFLYSRTLLKSVLIIRIRVPPKIDTNMIILII